MHCLLVEARMQTQQHIPTAKVCATQPEGFAREASHQITCDRARSILLADDETKARVIAGGPGVHDEVFGAAPRAQTKNG